MLESYSKIATLLLVAFLFGGMFLFSVGFAALLFKYLPPTDARMLIRNTFPPFYLFVIFSSGVAAVLSGQRDLFSAGWMAFVMLTAVAARQLLMPAINRATDTGFRKRFALLHGLSVVLTLTHIVVAGIVLVHMAS